MGRARKGVTFAHLQYYGVSAFKEFQKLIILRGNSNISPFFSSSAVTGSALKVEKKLLPLKK